jgi:hypothetical protein
MNMNISTFENYNLGQADHGFIFNILLYSAMLSTGFLISYLKPPTFWKKITTWILNLSFTWKGVVWKLYNVLAGVIFFLGILLFCKLIIIFSP